MLLPFAPPSSSHTDTSPGVVLLLILRLGVVSKEAVELFLPPERCKADRMEDFFARLSEPSRGAVVGVEEGEEEE